jgi:hypothetical protein
MKASLEHQLRIGETQQELFLSGQILDRKIQLLLHDWKMTFLRPLKMPQQCKTWHNKREMLHSLGNHYLVIALPPIDFDELSGASLIVLVS